MPDPVNQQPGIGKILSEAANSKPQKGFKAYKNSGKGSMDSMKKWLGDKGYKKFIANICQSVANQIKADKKIAQKAADRLKASIKGQPYSGD